MARQVYRYCPYCATPLVEQTIGERLLPACPACGFIHFPDPKVGVVAAIEHGDWLLLVRRGVNPSKGLWSLPGGYMNAGEMPKDALRREVAEEVGLAVTVEDLLAIHPMVNHGSPSRGIVMVYRAVIPGLPATAAPPPPTAADDADEARWFRPGDLPGDLAFESTVEEVRRWAETRAQARPDTRK